MKFLITKDLAHSQLLAYLMAGVLIAIFLYLCLDVVLHSYVIGTDMTEIHTTLFGNEETFEEPILIDSLLLQVHIDLFMTIFVLVILAAIYIRLHNATVSMKWILHTLFILGLAAPLLLLGAYFWAEAFVLVWAGSFLLWHLLAFWVCLSIFPRLKFR
ncbi:hypothetical protein YH65_02795 [Sulfurovum lithotrophicum]|uniref:Uncharacterized protein n=1 Tax=Sulfurovum lithotrophicum TaxID=206403 RepID=A0A7U4M076_9BACT|nr:hypothetical protein [Sulfurovum lithotrophicum]AKF24440.1 hypothetical protein YH65_02795 [Sulfurovum lithotrophicum]